MTPVLPVLGDLSDRTFDAVLFDMDGTLIDSVPAVERNWRRWAAEFGLPDAENFHIPHGTPAITVIRNLVPPSQVDAAYARINELELADNEGVRILPGTLEALSSLRDDRFAIVTSCTRPLAAARMKAAGLPRPQVVVTADDVVRGKPAPDPFLLGAEKVGAHPSRCLVVEDAPAGVAAARAAECAALAVTGTHSRRQLLSADPAPDAVVDGLAAVSFTVRDGEIEVAPVREGEREGATPPGRPLRPDDAHRP